MKESGPKPDQESFCAILHVCGSTGKAADAQRILSEMYTAGTEPDVKAFCGVLDACAKAKDVRRAREVLSSMPSHGVAPNVVAYTCMMDACVREGSAESLSQVCTFFLHCLCCTSTAQCVGTHQSTPCCGWSLSHCRWYFHLFTAMSHVALTCTLRRTYHAALLATMTQCCFIVSVCVGA